MFYYLKMMIKNHINKYAAAANIKPLTHQVRLFPRNKDHVAHCWTEGACQPGKQREYNLWVWHKYSICHYVQCPVSETATSFSLK